jgi:DME family drug/metabolite transporter
VESSIAQRAEARAWLLMVMGAAVLWGTVGIVTKTLYGISGATPLSIGFFRLALTAPFLWAAGWQTLKGRLLKISGRDLGLMALIGVVLALYQVCFFTAVAVLGVAAASLITLCSAPALVAALSAVLFRERPGLRVLAALACALIGTALMAGVTPTSLTTASLGGVGWALGSALGYAVFALTSRHLAGRCHPLQPTAVGFTVGALVLLLVGSGAGLTVAYPPLGWGLLLYLGIVPSALGYGLYFYGMRHTPAIVASVAALTEPLTATLLAWLIFHEGLSLLGLAGAALLCGALVVLWRR